MNGVLLLLFLFAVLVESLGVGGYRAASQSMAPTLLPSDHFVTVPIVRFDALDRGEILVFRRNNGKRTVEYVKRLIGLPGDRVQMVRGRLLLNGREVTREPIGGINLNDGRGWAAQYRETLPDGASYRIAEFGDDSGVDDTPEFLVPEGQLFFLGDNRDNSADSRNSIMGFVATKDVIGRAWAIYWSDDLSRIDLVTD